MDTITHTAIGACLGETIAGKQLGKKAMLWGAVANNLPDIDVICNLWATQTKALLLHRGITHSILVAVIFSPLLAWGCYKLYKKHNVVYGKWLLIFGSGFFLHILLDSLTTYGTGLFEPFSDYRVSFNTIFILDPVFMLPLLVAAIVLLILKKNSERRTGWARGGLYASGLYLTLIIFNKIQVNKVIENDLRSQNIAYSDYMATPTPINNFLWYIVARAAHHYHIGYYSIFDNPGKIAFEKVPRNDSLLIDNCEPEQVNDLIRFSQQYYCAGLINDTIIFSDMRFGQIGGWYKQGAPFVFNFKLARNCSNKTALQKGRFESFGSETTIQLFRRIKGIQNRTKN